MVSFNVMNVYMRLMNIVASCRMPYSPYLKRAIKNKITQNWYIFMMRFDINFVSFATKTIIGNSVMIQCRWNEENAKKNCRRREKSETVEKKRLMYHRGKRTTHKLPANRTSNLSSKSHNKNINNTEHESGSAAPISKFAWICSRSICSFSLFIWR